MKRERDDEQGVPQAAHRDDYKRARASYDHRSARGDSRGGGGARHHHHQHGGRERPRLQQYGGVARPQQLNDGNPNGNVEVRTLRTEREQDPHRLAQRQKQIDFGKNTLGYDRYCAEVPRHKRRKGEHPMTPDKTLNVSKKHFDQMVRRWRQALHDYDPPELKERLRAEAQQAAAAPVATVSAAVATGGESTEDADLDPDLADLDPSKQPSSTAAVPSIYDAFNDDEGIAVDYEDDDDDDLL